MSDRLYTLRNQATLYLSVKGIDHTDDRAVLEHLRATDMFPSLREELEAESLPREEPKR